MEKIIIKHPDGDISLVELQNDVDAAKAKGLTNQWAFTPETVQALINYIIENKK